VILVFELSMPRRGSWDGGWSGSKDYFARTRTFRKAEECRQATDLIGSYRYAWDDGWCAQVDVRQVDGKEAAKIRRASKGFCEYDWMIDSIIKYGEIRDPSKSRQE